MSILRPIVGNTYVAGNEKRLVTFVGKKKVQYKRPGGVKIYRTYRESWAAWIQLKISSTGITIETQEKKD